MHISLKAKIIILIDIVLLSGLLIMGSIVFGNFRRTLETEASGTVSALAKNVSSITSGLVDKEIASLQAVAVLPEMTGEDVSIEDRNRALSTLQNKNPSRYVYTGFADLRGDLYLVDKGTYISVAGEPFFTSSVKGKPYIQNPSHEKNFDTDVIYFSVPAIDEWGNTIGVYVSALKSKQLIDDITSLDLGSHIHPSVLDMASGAMVASLNEVSDKEGDTIQAAAAGGLADALMLAGRGETGTTIFTDPYTDMKMIAGYQPIGGYTSWAVFCGAPYDYYLSGLNGLSKIVLIVIIILFFACSTAAYFYLDHLLKPLGRMNDSFKDIASGSADLTSRMSVKTNDEIGEVVSSFNIFVSKLNDIMRDMKLSKNTLQSAGSTLGETTSLTAANITEILACIQSVQTQIKSQSSSVEETASAVTEITCNIESLDKMISNQSTGITQASAAIKQMVSNIQTVDASVDTVSRTFNELADSMSSGEKLQQEVSDKISKIENMSKMLQDANFAIASIAEQTNLLAMNAAIEAAHAGESGKGFSVVADEIRKLSETSSEQSKTIGTQLTSIQEAISGVVESSVQSSKAFEEVSSRMRNTDVLVKDIRNAMSEQNEGSKQISDALVLINNSTAQVRSASQEMSMGTKAIREEVIHLQDVTSVMNESVSEMGISAKKINEVEVQLTTVSDVVTDTISEIGAQVDQFKVE